MTPTRLGSGLLGGRADPEADVSEQSFGLRVRFYRGVSRAIRRVIRTDSRSSEPDADPLVCAAEASDNAGEGVLFDMPTSAVRPAPDATEQLFSISLNGRQIDCELRNFGERGVEVQFLSDREPFYELRLPTYELAREWADAERRAWGWIMQADTASSTEMGLARVIRPTTDR